MPNAPIPKISVIIAVYNGARTLQQCLDSVTQQEYPYIELIVVDGGSDDGTVDLLKANHNKISYWISESDSGIYHAWNKALVHATGDWVCFLGADDFLWNERTIADIATDLQRLPPNVRVAYGQIMLLTHEGNRIHPLGDPWDKAKERFRHVMSIPHQAVMHRRSMFDLNGHFDQSFRIAGDYELLLRELKAADAVFLPNQIVTGMRIGGISSDPKNSLKALNEIRRAQRMHGQRLPGRVWLAAVLRVYLRTIMWRLLGEKTSNKVIDTIRNQIGLPSYWTKK